MIGVVDSEMGRLIVDSIGSQRRRRRIQPFEVSMGGQKCDRGR